MSYTLADGNKTNEGQAANNVVYCQTEYPGSRTEVINFMLKTEPLSVSHHLYQQEKLQLKVQSFHAHNLVKLRHHSLSGNMQELI